MGCKIFIENFWLNARFMILIRFHVADSDVLSAMRSSFVPFTLCLRDNSSECNAFFKPFLFPRNVSFIQKENVTLTNL